MFFRSTRRMLQAILHNQSIIMAKIDDLKSAVANIATDFTTYSTNVDAKLAALTEANTGDGDGEAIDAAIKDLTDLHAAFKPKIDALAAAAGVPAPTAPTDAPAAS